MWEKTPTMPWGLSIQWHAQRLTKPWMLNELTRREKTWLSIKMLHSVLIRKSFGIYFPAYSVVTLFGCWGLVGQLYTLCGGRTDLWVCSIARTWKCFCMRACQWTHICKAVINAPWMFIHGCAAEVKLNLIAVLIWALVPAHYNSPGQLKCSHWL